MSDNFYNEVYGPKVDVFKLRKFLEKCFEMNDKSQNRMAICIWGPAGIGKTSIVKQFAKDGYQVVDLPIAQFEEMGDFHGLPITENKDGNLVTVTAAPEWVPTEEGKGILLLDDWNRADIRIIKGIMQLLQNYGMITWKLPKGWNIVCTGNPDNDEGYLVTAIDKAILTRMKHVYLQADEKAWAIWAENVGIDKRAISFILKYPEMLVASAERTNPRSWSEAFKILDYYPEINNKTIEDILIHIESCVDSTSAATFITFLQQDVSLVVEPDEILNNWSKAKKKFEKLAENDRIDMIAVSCERLFARISSDNYKLEKGHKENFQQFITCDIFDKKNMKDARFAFVYRMVHAKKKDLITLLTDNELLADLINEVV